MALEDKTMNAILTALQTMLTEEFGERPHWDDETKTHDGMESCFDLNQPMQECWWDKSKYLFEYYDECENLKAFATSTQEELIILLLDHLHFSQGARTPGDMRYVIFMDSSGPYSPVGDDPEKDSVDWELDEPTAEQWTEMYPSDPCVVHMEQSQNSGEK